MEGEFLAGGVADLAGVAFDFRPGPKECDREDESEEKINFHGVRLKREERGE